MSLTVIAPSNAIAGTWETLLKKTYELATNSPDPSTQNGSLLAIVNHDFPDGGFALPETFSVNEFPRGVAYTPERWERPRKYSVIEHAERNCIYAAARHGIKTADLTMVVPWAACADCARAIIQAGISRLVTHKQAADRSPQSWIESITIAFEMLEEAGVEVVTIDAVLGAPEVRHTGVIWTP